MSDAGKTTAKTNTEAKQEDLSDAQLESAAGGGREYSTWQVGYSDNLFSPVGSEAGPAEIDFVEVAGGDTTDGEGDTSDRLKSS